MKKAIQSSLLVMGILLACLNSSFCAEDTRDSDSPYGMLAFLSWDHNWNQNEFGGDKAEKAADLLKEMGVGFVRFDFYWSDIEPEKGRFEFEKYDRLVEILSKRNIKVLGLLGYNAAWAGSEWNTPPDPDAFAHFAEKTAEHFKDRVKYWEVWNEPDYPAYWTPQDNLKTYAALLKKVYAALKQADPSSVVLVGGLSQNISIQLNRLYKEGAGDSFDVVNIHPFVNPLLPNAMQLLKGEYRGVYRVMEKYADADKPIWITELGCPGTEDASMRAWPSGPNPNEAQQAEWVEKVYGEPLQWPGVKKIFWAFFKDTNKHFGNGGDALGLIRTDFSKKPAFESYKKVANQEKS
jgi:polysaccharide biosynthesis protein PslG